MMTHDDLIDEFSCMSKRFRCVLDKVDPRAESGIETMVRLRLESLNIRLRPQVSIPMVGRVDFLVGTSLIIEVER